MIILKYGIAITVQMYMLFIMLYCYKKIFNKELIINIKNITTVLLFSILLILNNLYCVIYIRLFISIILNILLNKFVFNGNIKETSKYTFIYFIISFLLELLLAAAFSVFDKSNITTFNKDIVIKNLFSITESTIVLFIMSNKTIVNIINKFIISIKNEINYTKIIIIVLTFLNIITVYLTRNLNNNSIIILSVSSIIFIALFIKIIVDDKYNIANLRMLNKNLKNSYRAYSKTVEDYKTLKHNLRNELYSIKTSLPKIYQGEIDKLIIKNNKDLDWVTKLNDIPEGLQGIFFLKKEEAKKKKIEFYISTSKKVTIEDKDYLDICDTVGILIDNAIESTNLQKCKAISVNINETKNHLSIEIINKFNNKININKIGKKNYSTKKIKSGIGLNYINKLNYKIKVKYKIINDLFIAELTYNNLKQNKKS